MRNRLTAVVMWMTLLSALASPAQAIIRWERDLESAKVLAKQTNRLLLVHFWSDDCPPCRRLEKNVFPNGAVQRALDSGYVAVKIHGKQSRHLTEQFDVRGWPTDIIMTADGKEIYRTTSPQDPNRYIRLLDTVAAHVRTNRQPENVVSHIAQTPHSPTAPTRPQPSRYSSSGLVGPQRQNPQRENPQQPNPQQRAAYAPNQPPQQPTGQQPNGRYNTTAPTTSHPAPSSRYGQSPQTPSVRTNPYVQSDSAAANRNNPGRDPRMATPNPTLNRDPASRYGAGQTVTNNRPATRQDPAERYGARSPAQNFAAAAGGHRTASGGQAAAPRAEQGSRYGSTQAAGNSALGNRAQPGADARADSQYPQTFGHYGPAYGNPNASPNNADQHYGANGGSGHVPQRYGQSGILPARSVVPSTANYGPLYTRSTSGNQDARQDLPQTNAEVSRTRMQNPSPPAMDGFCPVTLQEQRKWRKGDERFRVEHRGRVFHCVGPAELARFQSKPDFYTPLLSGFDPVHMLRGNVMVEGKREFGMWHEQSMLLFADESSLKAFWAEPEKYMPGIRQAMATQQNTGRWR